MGKNVRDMTSGNIWGHLIWFTIPLLTGTIFQQLYNMVDTIIVGHYVGTTALGAVGSIGSLNFLFFSLCSGLGSGIGILVAQYFGGGEHGKVKSAVAQAIYVTLAAGLLMSFIGAFLARPILTLQNTPPENFEYALTYMRIVCGFSFINAVYNSVSSIMRSLGDSKTPLKFLMLASVVNIVLDLLFVVVFKWGVAGVAIATVISQFISATGSIIYGYRHNPYMRLKKEDFKVNPMIIKREVMMGLPLALQSSTIAISCVVLQRVVNGFGSTVAAAYTASNKIEQLVQQPFNTLGVTMSTFAGQNYGAGKRDRVYSAARRGMVLVGGFSLLMVIVMYTLGPVIVGGFVDDTGAEVIKIGSAGLRFTSLMYIFLGAIYVMRGLLNGVGDVKFALINGGVEVAGRIGFALLLIQVFNVNHMAAWYTNGLTWSITGIISVLRFVFGGWRHRFPKAHKEVSNTAVAKSN